MNYANIFAKMFPKRNFCKVNMFPERNFQVYEMFPEREIDDQFIEPPYISRCVKSDIRIKRIQLLPFFASLPRTV